MEAQGPLVVQGCSPPVSGIFEVRIAILEGSLEVSEPTANAKEPAATFWQSVSEDIQRQKYPSTPKSRHATPKVLINAERPIFSQRRREAMARLWEMIGKYRDF